MLVVFEKFIKKETIGEKEKGYQLGQLIPA